MAHASDIQLTGGFLSVTLKVRVRAILLLQKKFVRVVMFVQNA
jgi:hypothetical protein